MTYHDMELEADNAAYWRQVGMNTLWILLAGLLLIAWVAYGNFAGQAAAVLDAYMGFLRWFELSARPTYGQFYLVALGGPFWLALMLAWLCKPLDRTFVQWRDDRAVRRMAERLERREAEERERLAREEALTRSLDEAVV